MKSFLKPSFISVSSHKVSPFGVFSCMTDCRALELFYCWVNFAPITRGTSATGYAVLYGIILSMGEELIDRVPLLKQLDWEAMLTPNPLDFVDRVIPWVTNRRPFTGFDDSEDKGVALIVADVFESYHDIMTAMNL
jgi:hypothetical protein